MNPTRRHLIALPLAAMQPFVRGNQDLLPTFRRLIESYGQLWTMTNGRIDLTRLDRFYAPDGEVVIFDFAPPGASKSWAAHREALNRELFANLKRNLYVPRLDSITLRTMGNNAAVTTFVFDYENEDKSGKVFRISGRQTNVWERRGNSWLIVHEHGSPLPNFQA